MRGLTPFKGSLSELLRKKSFNIILILKFVRKKKKKNKE